MSDNEQKMVSRFIGLRCQKCHRVFPTMMPDCPDDGGLLLSEYDLSPPLAWPPPRAVAGVWRFAELLPPLVRQISRGEGQTPLYVSRTFGSNWGIDLWLKDEGANPSGSFKDRGVAIMASTLDPSTKIVTMMSSGNAASSVALYSGLAGVHAVIFMYQGGTRAKAFMTQAYGATVLAVQAEREGDVLALAEGVAREKGWPLMNTVAAGNPFILDGYKTLAYELSEQLPDVDVVVLPVGSGTLISGVWKGFDELHRAGKILRIPRLIGVQPTGSCPIVNAFSADLPSVPRLLEAANTIASALTLDDPGESGVLALHAIRETKGHFIAVSDEAILSACQALAVDETILAEPAAAVSVAAIPEALEQGLIRAGERVVSVLTGHGLKDIDPLDGLLPSMNSVDTETAEFMDLLYIIESNLSLPH